ncbi:Uncharacterised protein [Yersinia enterocolitica]|nr:Uncharacterised protein [Yersinia enterocolitica]
MWWQVAAVITTLLKRLHYLIDNLVIVAQKIPVTVALILHFKRIPQHGDPLFITLLYIIDETALKAGSNTPMHSNKHQHTSGKYRHKQFSGNADSHDISTCFIGWPLSRMREADYG